MTQLQLHFQSTLMKLTIIKRRIVHPGFIYAEVSNGNSFVTNIPANVDGRRKMVLRTIKQS